LSASNAKLLTSSVGGKKLFLTIPQSKNPDVEIAQTLLLAAKYVMKMQPADNAQQDGRTPQAHHVSPYSPTAM